MHHQLIVADHIHTGARLSRPSWSIGSGSAVCDSSLAIEIVFGPRLQNLFAFRRSLSHSLSARNTNLTSQSASNISLVLFLFLCSSSPAPRWSTPIYNRAPFTTPLTSLFIIHHLPPPVTSSTEGSKAQSHTILPGLLVGESIYLA